jgi:hypothetical protein
MRITAQRKMRGAKSEGKTGKYGRPIWNSQSIEWVRVNQPAAGNGSVSIQKLDHSERQKLGSNCEARDE